MDALLAALPIVVVVTLMLGLGWPAWKAGLVSAALAVALGLAVFDLPDAAPSGAVAGVASTTAEASFTAVTILWIILPALAIHHLQVSTGATDVLRERLGQLSDDPRVLALLIGWFFALFAEGAAGFGASVALAAPFLVGVGFTPLRAVTIAFVGHVAGVSFGAIGTPIIPLEAATGLPGIEIAATNAIYHAVLGVVPLALLVRLAGHGSEHDAGGRVWLLAALAGAAFLVPYWLIATFVGPELPTLGGSLIGGAVFVGALMVLAGRAPDGSGDEIEPAERRHHPAADTSSEGPTADGRDGGAGDDRARAPATGGDGAPPAAADAASGTSEKVAGVTPISEPATVAVEEREAESAPVPLWQAGAPYLVLVGLVVVTRLVPVVRDPLGAVVVDWELPGGFAGSLAPLTHPGTLLVLSFLIGAWLQRVGTGDLRHAIVVTLRQLGPVTAALVAMLVLARTMVHAGMTVELAESAAEYAGAVWPLVAPVVGLLGTFVTGSATASNVLFADLQAETGEVLSLSVLGMMGAQGFGASVGNVICPHNLVAAGATVGMSGREGDIMRQTLPFAAVYVLLGGALTYLLT